MTASKLTAKALLRGSVSRYCERLQGAWQSRKNNKNAMHFTRLLRQNL
ncbi:MAG TPA: hypothetical protein LFV91_03160 [Rickettsia endosymbiont of Bembidion nr. Transversale]|nr:hypothetical protein [Rickettsia endosymbiont of Bembidion nr. Transversale]